MAERIPTRLTAVAAARKFGVTIGAAFLVLAIASRWRGSATGSVGLASIGVALLVAALVVPRALVPIERGWMRGASLLSKATTPIFMGIIYFGVFTPAGMVRRVLGKRALTRVGTPDSYWVRRAVDRQRSDLERQF